MSLGDIFYKGVLTTSHVASGTITILTPGNDPDIVITSDSFKALLARIDILERYVTILQQTYEIRNPITRGIVTLESLRQS